MVFKHCLGPTSVLLLLAATLLPTEGTGQVLAVGGHVSMNRDVVDDNTWGVGGRAQLSLPLTGVTLLGTADIFSPDCGPLDCDLQEASLNLLWSFPIPFVATPYIGSGLVAQNTDGNSGLGNDVYYGIQFMGGVVLGGPAFPRFRPFAEFKYQAMDDLDSQTVISAGIYLVIF